MTALPHNHFVRFAVVGAGVAALYVVLYLALLTAGLAQPVANAAAFTLAVVAQYLGQTLFTFQRPLASASQITRFLVMIGLGLAVSAAITGAVGPALGWANWASAIAVTLILPVQNYLFLRLWVYATTEAAAET